MVLINDPSSSFILPVKQFLISLLRSIQSIVFVCGRISPQDFEMFFHKPTTSLLFSLLVFQQLRSTLLLKMFFSSSFEVEDVVFSSVLLIPFLHLFRRHCDVALFNPSSCFVKIMFYSFHLQSQCCPNYIILIPSLSCFNRSVLSIIPLLTGLSSKCFHFAKLIFFTFHFQLECCHN